MNCTSRYNVLHQKKMWAGENRKCVSCVLKNPKCRSVIKTLLRDFPTIMIQITCSGIHANV